MISVNHIVLTPESRKKLKKIKYWSYGNVADTIECADTWSVPIESCEYVDIRDALVNGFVQFFSLKDPSMVEIKRFESNILSFDKGIYPDYSKDTPVRKKPSSKKKTVSKQKPTKKTVKKTRKGRNASR